MSADAVPRNRKKLIRGTNIVVQKSATDGVQNPRLALLYSIAPDDASEMNWWNTTLRPERNLIHPSDAFLQGIKALRPAARFNTFDIKKARLRRLVKQEKDKLKHLERRKREVAPTAAMKASVNPHRVPRTGGHAPEEEVRVLSRGQKKKAKQTEGTETPKAFFHKWKKEKLKKIGKGL